MIYIISYQSWQTFRCHRDARFVTSAHIDKSVKQLHTATLGVIFETRVANAQDWHVMYIYKVLLCYTANSFRKVLKRASGSRIFYSSSLGKTGNASDFKGNDREQTFSKQFFFVLFCLIT